MSALLLAALVALQGAEVTASVNRTRLTVGEELVLTVRARTRSPDVVQLLLPPLSGFAIVGSRDLTEVSLTGSAGAIRTTVRELHLRAEQAGALLIGPVRARHGRSVVATEPILITVDSAANRFAAALSPIARHMLEAAPAPLHSAERPDHVALTVLTSADTVFAGEQVDLVAAAWIPRALRERMRRLPVLTLVTPEGVWAYPATTPAGVAASRQVGGRWIDLFITHQTVFPLAAGRLLVPPASVEYALPVTFSFFSREERYSQRSDTVRVAVLPVPLAGRPGDVGHRGADVVGRDLTLDVRIDPLATRVGEPVEAAVTVSGIGNVALWPEPVLRWPSGFRAYPAQTEVRLAPRSGLIAGAKTFRFLGVPDSAGNFVLPDVRYSFYEVAAGTYRVAAAAPRVLTIAPGAELHAARTLPPLLGNRRETGVDLVARRLGWGGVILFLLPPLAWLFGRRRAAAPRSVTAGETGTPGVTPLGVLERQFLAVLTSHVPDAFARDGDGLARALRAAGVDGAVADHVKRLRDRLRAARYGPRGLGDAAELGAEIRQVFHVLGADAAEAHGPRWRRRTIVALLCGVLAAPLQAQTPAADVLYDAGALRAAADSFAARAAAEPGDAAHWYNLGATLYRAGADGKATAAWTIAARLAPRDATIRRARLLIPAPDAASEPLLHVGRATPAEWAAIAAVAWLLVWVAALRRRPPRVVLLILGAIAVGAAVTGGIEWRRRARPVA
ncbi:MAG: BatD family protein, partial [Gemmatimonadales bacterium]|nr:BatD family protein [Gemmatimonadales bacterium]